PGGRFSKDYGGVREMAQALAVGGRRVVIWDRPNCGASDLAFRGSSESDVQADALAGLLRCLELAPAVIIGGSGGSRVSLLTVAHHPDVASGLAVWWISGGPFGLLSLAMHYCGNSISAAWREGMEAVAALPEWQESLERNPRNRQRLLEQDRREFISTLERWMLAYCPSDDEVVPGLARSEAARITVPTLVFRSGTTDVHHTRATSEDVAQAIPTAELVDPPWRDNEWNERGASGESLFIRWPLLVPQLQEWAGKALGA
ncbi:MAG TPA: alpha/beta hydrolase, partial [Acidimicrobiales bacterium]|nr:alpha/beta hydrolase [Acidimicrobiales bacterium]